MSGHSARLTCHKEVPQDYTTRTKSVCMGSCCGITDYGEQCTMCCWKYCNPFRALSRQMNNGGNAKSKQSVQ